MQNQDLKISEAVQQQVEGLAGDQRVAFEALAAGQGIVAAAQAAGVNRSTLYRWIHADPLFRATYNAWKRESTESAQGRLVGLANEAVNVVEDALRNGDAKVATTMLRTMGVMRTPRRGSTNPHLVELKMELGRWQEQYRIVMAMLKHLMDKMGVPPEMHNEFIRAQALARKARAGRAKAASSGIPGPAKPGAPTMAEAENPADEPSASGIGNAEELIRPRATADERLAGEEGELIAECDETTDEPGETLEEMVLKVQRTVVEEFISDPRHKSLCEKALNSLSASAPTDIANETTAARHDDAPHTVFE